MSTCRCCGQPLPESVPVWEQDGCDDCGVKAGEPCKPACPVEDCDCPTHTSPDSAVTDRQGR